MAMSAWCSSTFNQPLYTVHRELHRIRWTVHRADAAEA